MPPLIQKSVGIPGKRGKGRAVLIPEIWAKRNNERQSFQIR
jgi:hypothetical protein